MIYKCSDFSHTSGDMSRLSVHLFKCKLKYLNDRVDCQEILLYFGVWLISLPAKQMTFPWDSAVSLFGADYINRRWHNTLNFDDEHG